MTLTGGGLTAPANPKGEKMASKHKHLPIQVGTIIYNEKDRLPKWLKHWQPLAERIVIIDQGSDDGTQKILDDSGVTWFERLPRGNPDIHWNDLIGLAHANRPFFRLGVDEFIAKTRIKKILKVAAAHPYIVLWWVKRINWVNGIDISEHPEVKRLLGNDWQAIISFGRPYSFTGRMHGWPKVLCPGDKAGYIDGDIAWVDHRRTMDDVVSANVNREHMCRSGAKGDQDWFIKVCREVIAKNKGEIIERE